MKSMSLSGVSKILSFVVLAGWLAVTVLGFFVVMSAEPTDEGLLSKESGGAPYAEYVSHVVESGETLALLSRSYGSDVEEVKILNGLVSDTIYPGQELVVPAEGVITASWYGEWFNDKPMANARPYNVDDLVIAHRYLTLGTCVWLLNPETGKSVIAQVEDRIARQYADRWDLSPRVFTTELGIPPGAGVAELEYKIVSCGSPEALAYLAQ